MVYIQGAKLNEEFEKRLLNFILVIQLSNGFYLKNFPSFKIIFCQQKSCPRLTLGNADRAKFGTMALRKKLFFPILDHLQLL